MAELSASGHPGHLADCSPAAATARQLALALNIALIAWVIAWYVVPAWTLRSLLVGMALTLPLWPPLPGLWRWHRRTFAWATLCVIPYFVIGTTETIANPASRPWTGPCLGLSLALFVTLIAYLRLTRHPMPANASNEVGVV